VLPDRAEVRLSLARRLHFDAAMLLGFDLVFWAAIGVAAISIALSGAV
jgi:hypothetical protein